MKIIPYGRQCIDNADIKAVVKTLKADFITQGPQINKFEKGLCKYTGAKYAVVVSSGTAALHIACRAAGIEQGDSVITSPLSFVASANCVLYCNGKVIFADIQSDTGNIDPQKIRKKITNKTKAIIPVHFAGHPCDLEEIHRIATKNNLVVIEDAAHAMGATYKNSKIGACKYSDMTTFSFHPLKTITSGEGGAVLTNSKTYYKRLLGLREHGISRDSFCNRPSGKWYYEMQQLGFNYRLTDFQASLGNSQLSKLDKFIAKRRYIASRYNNIFSGNQFFDISAERDYVSSAYHLYPIALQVIYIKHKKRIFKNLRKKGLGVQVHYIPIYLQPFYRKLNYREGIAPNAELFYKREISLPIYYSMLNKDIKNVATAILKTMKEFV